MNYIFQIICHTMKIAYVPWQPHLEGEQKIEDPGRKLHLLIISFCCISTCEQSLEMSRVKLPRKVMRVVQRNTVTFLNLSSTAIKQSHVISHWSWQDFNVFGQVVGFVVWLQPAAAGGTQTGKALTSVSSNLANKKTGREWFKKRLVLIRKNSSCAKFTLSLGWNAGSMYIIHEKNLTLEIAPRVPEFRDLFSLGGPRCWLHRPALLKGKLRRGLVHERFFLNESNDSTPETVKNSALRTWKSTPWKVKVTYSQLQLRIAGFNFLDSMRKDSHVLC